MPDNSPPLPTFPVDSVDKVDSLLSELEKTRLRLTTARNAMMPACRLPVEVLSHIFLYLPGPDCGEYCVPRTKPWLPVTQVCSYWRAVAVGCARLWTSIEVLRVNPDWTAEMIKRSKRASIQLRAQLYDPSHHAISASKRVVTQLSRISDIHLAGNQKSLGPLVRLLTGEAPRLRSLVISNMFWKAHADIMHIPATFITGGAPLLEHLELNTCLLDWGAPFFGSCPNVTSMTINGAMSNQPTLSQLHTILSRMPSLQQLHLDNALPHAQSRPFLDSHCQIRLSHLRKLFLSGGCSDVTCLLNRLVIPASAAVQLVCTSSEKAEEVISLAAAITKCRDPSAQTLPLPALSMHLDATDVILWAGADHSAKLETVPMHCTDEGCVALKLRGLPLEPAQCWSALGALLRVFVLGSVRSLLCADRQGFLEVKSYQEMLREMTGVTKVHAQDEAASFLPAALSSVERDADKVVSLVPRLEMLILEGGDMGLVVDDSPVIHALQEAQFVRCDLGQPILDLHIRRCLNIGQRDVRTLSHLFTDVQWDGSEVYVSDSAESDSEYEDWDAVAAAEDWWNGELGWHS